MPLSFRATSTRRPPRLACFCSTVAAGWSISASPVLAAASEERLREHLLGQAGSCTRSATEFDFEASPYPVSLYRHYFAVYLGTSAGRLPECNEAVVDEVPIGKEWPMPQLQEVGNVVKISVVGTIRGTGEVLQAVTETVSNSLVVVLRGTGAVGGALTGAGVGCRVRRDPWRG